MCPVLYIFLRIKNLNSLRFEVYLVNKKYLREKKNNTGKKSIDQLYFQTWQHKQDTLSYMVYVGHY